MNNKWLIWSFEHDGWWRANSQGYTKQQDLAGQYEFEEAYGICQRANLMLARGEFPMATSGKGRF